MFKTYDATQAAYVEHSGKYYDLQQSAWVDIPSAKTYDTAEAAWIERMYAGYFILSNDSGKTQLQSGDILDVTGNGFVLRSFSKNKARFVTFLLPFKWKAGDVIEGDIVTNALGRISVGWVYRYNNSQYRSSSLVNCMGEYNQHFSKNFTLACPDTYEGYTVLDNFITVYGGVYENMATGETYSEIKNLTINGKKYGFTE